MIIIVVLISVSHFVHIHFSNLFIIREPYIVVVYR